MRYMQWVHNNVADQLINKLMTCPWCIAGQMALWTDIVMFLLNGLEAGEFLTLICNIPASILIVRELSLKNRH